MNHGVAFFGGLGFGDDGHFSGIHSFMVVMGMVFTATMVSVGLSSTPSMGAIGVVSTPFMVTPSAMEPVGVMSTTSMVAMGVVLTSFAMVAVGVVSTTSMVALGVVFTTMLVVTGWGWMIIIRTCRGMQVISNAAIKHCIQDTNINISALITCFHSGESLLRKMFLLVSGCWSSW